MTKDEVPTMSNEVSTQITDAELISQLKEAVKQERDLVAKVLSYLRIVEERELFLKRGYSSMFGFCMTELAYSEAEAHIRLQAMRLMRTLPIVEKQIEEGQLSLSVAAKAQSYFRREKLAPQDQLKIVEDLRGTSTRSAERKLAARFPDKPKREVKRAVSETETRITFTANKTQTDKFDYLKGRLAHKNFNGRYDLLFEALADIAIAKIDAPLLSARKVSQPAKQQVKPQKRTRYIQKATRLQIRETAKNQCQFVDAVTGRRCDSNHGLQIDHIEEFAKGGSNEPSNLQLLCGAHNRWRSRAN
jgi:hypothetical protein